MSLQCWKAPVFDRPVNIHLPLMQRSNDFEGESVKFAVNGDYLYFHYMQDGKNDNGWGCAYRSLQTLLSYFVVNGLTSKKPMKRPSITKEYDQVPTHDEIQRALVEMEDKEKDLIGSN